MELFRHGLLICCVFTATTVCSPKDVVGKRDGATASNSDEYRDEIVAAENHEHHRIIIVVPKEIPQHVNHVHTYKLSGKGIPLIHSGKVVHDHKHSGKVAHGHEHAGKSEHNHKHAGVHGHRHKHGGYFGHKHFGGHHHKYSQQHQQQSAEEYPHHNDAQLHAAVHKLRNQLNVGNDYLQQQHEYRQDGAPYPQRGGLPAVTNHVQFVPSSQPQGLGSFVPSEIQRLVNDRHQQRQQPYAVNDGGDSPPNPFNAIRLRAPDQRGPNIGNHLGVDLTNNNNVVKLQPVTANYKAVAQRYNNNGGGGGGNRVIGHGRAKPPKKPEDEFDSNADDENNGGGGGGGGDRDVDGGGANEGDELSVEDVGYRFGEGYRLALDSNAAAKGVVRDDDDLDEFGEFTDDSDDVTAAVLEDDHDPSDANAYSQTYVNMLNI